MNLPAGEPDDTPTEPAHPATATDDTPTESASVIDLDRIERDLTGVEAALRRLDDGTYWTDEVTGDPIPDDVLAADPVARRAATEH